MCIFTQQSIVHDDFPPEKNWVRLHTNLSGFLVEELQESPEPKSKLYFFIESDFGIPLLLAKKFVPRNANYAHKLQ